MTDDTEWPDPAPDPETEPGEDPDTHLLPNRERLSRMTRDERRDLVATVHDWTGPVVERWRELVREVDNGT